MTVYLHLCLHYTNLTFEIQSLFEIILAKYKLCY